MIRHRTDAKPRRLLRRLLLPSLPLLASAALCTPAAAQTAADHGKAFDANCSMCHQLDAMGVPGQFPRLAGRAAGIAATAAGRNYLERVVLSGMIGTITVDGTKIVGGVMPSFSSLSDQDLAEVLDYIVSLDASGKLHWQGAVFKPADIERTRADKPLSPAQVHELRATALGGEHR